MICLFAFVLRALFVCWVLLLLCLYILAAKFSSRLVSSTSLSFSVVWYWPFGIVVALFNINWMKHFIFYFNFDYCSWCAWLLCKINMAVFYLSLFFSFSGSSIWKQLHQRNLLNFRIFVIINMKKTQNQNINKKTKKNQNSFLIIVLFCWHRQQDALN